MTPRMLPAFLDATDPLADAETIELFGAIIEALDGPASLPAQARVRDDFRQMLQNEINRILDSRSDA